MGKCAQVLKESYLTQLRVYDVILDGNRIKHVYHIPFFFPRFYVEECWFLKVLIGYATTEMTNTISRIAI